MRYNVPFYGNIDDTHCFQAVIKMVAAYFWPEEKYTWEDLDQITGKVPGLWTWPTLGCLWLQEKRIEVIVEGLFDYPAFIEKGGQYLMEFAGTEAGREQISHSVLPLEISRATQAIDQLTIHTVLPSCKSIKEYLEKGYLVICNVNACRLNQKRGYVGHFVLIVGFDGDDLILHDPGKPPLPFRRVNVSDFKLAWGDPEARMRNLVAIRKRPEQQSLLREESDL